MNCRPAARLCGALLAVTVFCAAPRTSEAQVVYDFWTSMFGPYNYGYDYGYGYGGYGGYGYTGYGYSAYSPSYNTAWYPSTGWYSSGYAGYSAGYIGDSCNTCGTTSCYNDCSPCGSSCSPCSSGCSPCGSGCGYACADGSCASGNCSSGNCDSGDCGFQPPTSRPSRDLQPTPAGDAPPRTYDEEPRRRNPIDEGFSPRRNERDSEKDDFPSVPPSDDFRTPETEIRRRPMAPVKPPVPEVDEVTRRHSHPRLAVVRPLNLDARQTAWQPVAERTRLQARATFSAPRVARVRAPLNQGWTAVAKQPAPKRTAGSRTERTRLETSRLEVAGRRTR